MTLPNWKPEDYFVDFEPVYYGGPIKNAPLVMKVGWVLRYLHDVIFPDAIKAVVNGGELAGLLLSFSIVDYLTGYFAGKSSTARDFVAFMNRYYPELYKPYIDDIYHHLRSGLVHNLNLRNPWIKTTIPFSISKETEFHLQPKDGTVKFSIHHFIEDTRRAGVMYFYDLIMRSTENQELIKKFHKRFNKQDGAASMMIKNDD